MTVPAPCLAPTPLHGLSDFTGRVRPLIDEGLAHTVVAVPEVLIPVQTAVGRAVGVNGRAGRRWRPLVTLAVAEAVGGSARDAVDAAVAVELTHTASLVLDDLPCMDDSPVRRGEPSTHQLLGTAGAILVAVGLLARAAELLGSNADHGAALSRVWGTTFGFQGMSGGQAVDVALGGTCRGAMRRLYRRKTTSLVAFAVDAGALLGGAPLATRRRLHRFGESLGWAYQLVDDAHDVGEDLELGRAGASSNPLRHADRLLERGILAMRSAPSMAPGGAALLEELARDVVRVPPLTSLDPKQEVPSC